MMTKKIISLFTLFWLCISLFGQINTDRVMANGKNALHFEDYILAIQYFNQVIKVKPYLADPYFYRAVAKLSLNDFSGAEEDCSLCLERNPFIIKAYECRAIARQQLDEFDGAISDYNRVLEYYPNEKELMHNRAVAHAQKKDYETAEKELDEIIGRHPDFSKAYLTRGRMYVEKGDTVKALEDLDKTIELDKFSSYSYATRAMIHYMQENYEDAISDYTEAIRIEPQQGYYVNRGLANYQLANLREAMDDYDRAVEMNPNDVISRYNRGILRTQVADNNRAIEDFDRVLDLEPDNYFAYYNRAMLRTQTGDFQGAIADYTTVLEEYPDFTPGYQSRSVAKRLMGDAAGADRDLMAAWRMEEQSRRGGNTGRTSATDEEDTASSNEEDPDAKTRKQSDKNIKNFDKVVVADNISNESSKYDSEIRGRVQDRSVNLELLPMFVTTFYEKPDALKLRSYYNQILFDFNKTPLNDRILRITNAEAALAERQIEEHFQSINRYTRRIDANPDNPDLYFARGLDFLLVQDFSAAIENFTNALRYKEDFLLAYFNRAVARTRLLELEAYSQPLETSKPPAPVFGKAQPSLSPVPPVPEVKPKGIDYELIFADYEKILSLSPEFFYAYFNRGNIRFQVQKDYHGAIEDYSAAVKIEPEFSEAYFNRGLAYIYLGENDKAVADLSKAGELGIISSYNIIKRLGDLRN